MNEQELADANHYEVWRILGVTDRANPPQAVRNLLSCGVPHLRLSPRRIRFHLPTLREWIAAQATQQKKTLSQDELPTTA